MPYDSLCRVNLYIHARVVHMHETLAVEVQVQGDPRRPEQVNKWAPPPSAKEEPSAAGTFLTIAASILGCAAIFLKVRPMMYPIAAQWEGLAGCQEELRKYQAC